MTEITGQEALERGLITYEDAVRLSEAKNRAGRSLINSPALSQIRSDLVIGGITLSAWMIKDYDVTINLHVLNCKDAQSLKYRKDFLQKTYADLGPTAIPVAASPNVIYTHVSKLHNMTIIYTDFPDRKSILKYVDYVHCTPQYHEGKIYFTAEAMDAIRNKKLIRRFPLTPNSDREQWFLNRGWTK